MLRSTLFVTPAMAIWGLLPLIASRQLGLGADGFGALFAALGVGAVIGAALPTTEYERDLVARARDSAGPLLDDVSQALRSAGNTEVGSQTISH